jgi:hypothetical protein
LSRCGRSSTLTLLLFVFFFLPRTDRLEPGVDPVHHAADIHRGCAVVTAGAPSVGEAVADHAEEVLASLDVASIVSALGGVPRCTVKCGDALRGGFEGIQEVLLSVGKVGWRERIAESVEGVHPYGKKEAEKSGGCRKSTGWNAR